jgi:hypothetical protein
MQTETHLNRRSNLKLLTKLLIVLVMVSIFTYCFPSCEDLYEAPRAAIALDSTPPGI